MLSRIKPCWQIHTRKLYLLNKFSYNQRAKSLTTMEVTKDNFVKAFALLQSSIKDADFIAIDGEFTGLSTLKGRRSSYDTLEEKFEKLRRGTSQFMLVQYGICLFTWNKEKEVYEALPFTFYLFPRPYKRFYNDVMFMCQSSSLDFLANNGFDFNKLFHKGISYLSPWQDAKVKERLEKDLSFCAASASANPEIEASTKKIFIPQNQRVFIDDILKKVNDFLADKNIKTLDLPTCNAFQRKLIYEKLEDKYPIGLYLESAAFEGTNDKFVRAIKVTASGLNDLKSESRRKEIELYEEILGFSKVMKLLAEVKKPIIGHNMLLDIFLTVFNFYDNSVSNYKDFKMLVHSIFPTLFDTKVMLSNEPLASKVDGTSLSKLYGSITSGDLPDPLVTQVHKLDEDCRTEGQFHQAGYDAFCTGSIFISAAKCLLEGLNLPSKRIDMDSDIISLYANRVHILGIRDIFYTDFSLDDKIPNRKCVFYVNFPKGWGENDFNDLFSSVCSLSKPTIWLNDTSVYVTISNEQKYQEVYETFVLDKKPTDSYYVLPYAETVHSRQPEYKSNFKSADVTKNRGEVSPVKKDSKRKKVESDIEEGELESDDENTSLNNGSKKMKTESGLFEAPNEW